LELRHQRTGDVVFDYYNDTNQQQKPDFYMYKLIEILLPRAMVTAKKETAKKDGKNTHLKMVELWA
jgi:hypothetical protein